MLHKPIDDACIVRQQCINKEAEEFEIEYSVN